MTFTETEIREAARQVAQRVVMVLPGKIQDFLTQSQLDTLIDEAAVSIKDSLMFSLTNHIEA